MRLLSLFYSSFIPVLSLFHNEYLIICSKKKGSIWLPFPIILIKTISLYQ